MDEAHQRRYTFRGNLEQFHASMELLAIDIKRQWTSSEGELSVYLETVRPATAAWIVQLKSDPERIAAICALERSVKHTDVVFMDGSFPFLPPAKYWKLIGALFETFCDKIVGSVQLTPDRTVPTYVPKGARATGLSTGPQPVLMTSSSNGPCTSRIGRFASGLPPAVA